MLSSIIEQLPSIISAIGTLAAVWFTYNQYTKNKITDYKIENWKKEETQRNIKKAGNIATIYGELWELLHFLKADRVYIIQPHPLYEAMFISATLEVKRNGISSIRDNFLDIKIDTIAKFVSEIANLEYIVIDDTEEQDIDKKMKSVMLYNGCKTIFIRRMSDDKNNWIGNLVISYTGDFDNVGVSEEYLERTLKNSALLIQYILPEYKVPDKE